ncbi:MAG: GNAT family N-acetyltransferase [Solirubrobacteraceae bacterium]
MSGAVDVRAATVADVEPIYAFIVELAEYERSRDQVVGTPELLADALFGPHPAAEALIAEHDGEPAGFAIFCASFSTWECRPGLWLEDLYVSPAHRRAGLGGVLLSRLAEIALNRGCPRLEWTALEWNQPALDFYTRLGATRLPEWQRHRLSGSALQRVAGLPPR